VPAESLRKNGEAKAATEKSKTKKSSQKKKVKST
jgi:hypothetical protein